MVKQHRMPPQVRPQCPVVERCPECLECPALARCQPVERCQLLEQCRLLEHYQPLERCQPPVRCRPAQQWQIRIQQEPSLELPMPHPAQRVRYLVQPPSLRPEHQWQIRIQQEPSLELPMPHPVQRVRYLVQPQSLRPVRRVQGLHYREHLAQLQTQWPRSLEFRMLCQAQREQVQEAQQGFRACPVVKAVLRTRSHSRAHLVFLLKRSRST